jgi:TolA-binding protein
LREWLHYRKVRILALYAPKTVPEATAAMEREYPKSQLMDDALAEQIYAQAVVLRDLNAAQTTFKKLIDNYPTGNAIDNAHTWMAIVFRCEGRVADAQNMNRRIINLFSRTRHARYARERMAKTDACGL